MVVDELTHAGEVVSVAPTGADRQSARRSRSGRFVGLPLAVHVGLLAVVMLVGLAVFGQGAVFHPDEGAMLLQEEILDQTGRFAAPNPQPDLDPEMEALPIELASRTDAGTWLPFAKHPTYVWAMAGATALFGAQGPLLLSCLGVVLAALGAALIARQVRPSLSVPTLWATAVAAPLFFDGYLVLGHAVGAALAAFLALAVIRAVSAIGTRLWILGLAAAGLAALLVLVRTEGAFLVAALAAAAAVSLTPRRRSVVVAIGIVLAAVVAYRRIDPTLVLRSAGTSGLAETGEVGAEDIGRTLGGRWDAFWTSLLQPSVAGSPVADVAGITAAISLWYGALRLRRPTGEDIGLILLVVGVVSYVIAALAGGLTSGLLVATPVLAGLVGLRRSDVHEPVIKTLLVAWLLFMAAVVATQYDTAGGAHVGGRYFVIGLPLIAPAAVLGWTRLRERVTPAANRWIPALLVAAVVATALQAGFAMGDQREFVQSVVDHVEAVRAEAGGPDGPAAVLSTNGWGSRYAWEIVDEGTWLASPNEHLDRYSTRLLARGEPVVLFTANPEYDESVLSRHWDVDWRSDFAAVLTPR